MISDWKAQLEAIERDHHLRTLSTVEARIGTTVKIGGRRLVNFSSNDYLGLAAHPRVVEAAGQAAGQWGSGAGASRLVTGSLDLHRRLEEALARFKGTESALVFSSGYMAALGLIQILSRRADGSSVPVYFDRLSHASLVDAARHSDSPWRSFAHNDPEALERLLQKQRTRAEAQTAGEGGAAAGPKGSPTAVVVTEGVFSMDGDMAPLPELLAVCEKWGAVLVVDDAHGTGTVGPDGRGSVAHFGVPATSPHLIQMGTLSKSLGSQGGFVAGPDVLIRLLVNRARTFIYDTALAPPAAAAALEALRLLQDEPEHFRNLQTNIRLLHHELAARGWSFTPSGERDALTPILPLILGLPRKVLDAAAALREAGHLVIAIRPPTVPPGTSRLRLTVTAAHTAEQIRDVAAALPEKPEDIPVPVE